MKSLRARLCSIAWISDGTSKTGSFLRPDAFAATAKSLPRLIEAGVDHHRFFVGLETFIVLLQLTVGVAEIVPKVFVFRERFHAHLWNARTASASLCC